MATTEHSDLEQQIIKTAQQLFIEKGFVETSMSDIAATVGINRPTLHYYFRTKDKMFKAVFGSIVMSLMPKIQDIVKQDITAAIKKLTEDNELRNSLSEKSREIAKNEFEYAAKMEDFYKKYIVGELK